MGMLYLFLKKSWTITHQSFWSDKYLLFLVHEKWHVSIQVNAYLLESKQTVLFHSAVKNQNMPLIDIYTKQNRESKMTQSCKI